MSKVVEVACATCGATFKMQKHLTKRRFKARDGRWKRKPLKCEACYVPQREWDRQKGITGRGQLPAGKTKATRKALEQGAVPAHALSDKPWDKALAVECPSCGAEPDRRCDALSGYTHRERIAAWRRIRDAANAAGGELRPFSGGLIRPR